jgi:hypothetical protein
MYFCNIILKTNFLFFLLTSILSIAHSLMVLIWVSSLHVLEMWVGAIEFIRQSEDRQHTYGFKGYTILNNFFREHICTQGSCAYLRVRFGWAW